MLRSALWSARILGAAIAGAIVRVIRRVTHKPPRIWHGFWALHTAADHARVDRLAGYPSWVVVDRMSHFAYEIYERERFDIVWEDRGIAPKDRHWRGLEHLLLHGDIWVPFFDCLFFGGRARLNRLSFRLIRAMGIRIIAVTQGGDVVHQPRWVSRFDWVGRWFQDHSNWDVTAQRSIAGHRIGMFCRFADLVVTDGAYTTRFLPRIDLCFKYFPVDLETFAISPTSVHHGDPIIVHATNHRAVKGTDFVLDSIARLARQGVGVELRIIECKPRLQAIEEYRAADVIADQFVMGSFGCFAMEAMALGKPVVGYSDQEELGAPAFNVPIVNANRDNLDKVFAVLLRLPELRSRLGKASRAAAERYLSFAPLAEVWARIYEHVWRGTPLDLASTAIFHRDRPARSFTEDPTREAFWPVDVSDLMPQIREIVAQVRASPSSNETAGR